MPSLEFTRLARDLWHHKGQVLILTIILGMGGGSWFGMGLMIEWRRHNVYNFYNAQKLDDAVLYFPADFGVDKATLDSTIANFSGISDITAWEARLRISLSYELNLSGKTEIFRGYLYGLSTKQWEDPALDILALQKGHLLSAADINNPVIVLDHLFQKEYNVPLDSTIKLRLGSYTQAVTIVGTSSSPEWIAIIDPESTSIGYTLSFAIAYTHLTTLQTLLGAPGRVNEVMFRLNSGVNIDEFGKELTSYLISQGLLAEFQNRKEMPIYEATEDDMESDVKTMTMLAVFIFVVAIFGLWISLNRMVTHQKREIGIELSLGITSGKIMRFYLSYGVLIGVLGMVFSYGFGWLFGLEMDVLNQIFYPIPNWENPMYWEGLYQAWALCLGIAFLGSWYPARQASQLLPIKAMRQDPAVSAVHGANNSKITQWLTHFGFMSMNLKMAMRNIIRNRRRSAATVIGFGLSVGLVIGTIGLFGSLDNVVAVQKTEMGEWDIRATLYLPIPLQNLSIISQQASVEKAIYGLSYFAKLHIGNGNDPELIQVMGFSDTSLIPYMIEKGAIDEGPTGANAPMIAISSTFAQEKSVNYGQMIMLEHASFLLPLTYAIQNTSLKVGALHERTTKIEAIMGWDAVQSLFNATGCANQVYLSVAANNIESVRKFLYTLPFVRMVEIQEEALGSFTEMFADFMDVMWIIEIMCFCLAFGVILLTSMITRSERQREIGTMATLGASDSGILGILVWESLFLAISGIIFGFALGYVVLDTVLLPQMNLTFDAFILTTYIPLNSYLFVGGLALGLALTSQLPLLNTLRKVDLAQATKVRDF